MRSAPYVAVVRRGNILTYNFLKEQFESQGLMEVIWDRRSEPHNRRRTRKVIASERRERSRRRPLPATWDTLGFVLVRREN